MREAQKINVSRVEVQCQRAIVDFQVQVAQMRKEKEFAKVIKLKADTERLSKVVLIRVVSEIYNTVKKVTVAQMGDQIDAFCFH